MSSESPESIPTAVKMWELGGNWPGNIVGPWESDWIFPPPDQVPVPANLDVRVSSAFELVFQPWSGPESNQTE